MGDWHDAVINPYHNNCIGVARNRPYTSYFRLHACYFDSRLLLRLKPTHSEMDCVSRGGTETRSCAVFSIFNSANTDANLSHWAATIGGIGDWHDAVINPYHNNCIGAARNRPYTSYFRLHACYFDSRLLLRLKPTHSEMDCVSRGGTETRSCGVFSIFNSANTDAKTPAHHVIPCGK